MQYFWANFIYFLKNVIDTDTDTLLKIQATNVYEYVTIRWQLHTKQYKLKIDQSAKERFKTSKLH